MDAPAAAIRERPARRSRRQRWAAAGGGHLGTLAVVGAIYFSLGMGIDMLLALLPAIATSFQVSVVVVVWLVTVRSGGKILAPLLGVLSDRVGRKPALLISLSLFGLGCAASAAAGSFPALMAAQGLAGLGLAGAQVSLPAYLGDLFPYHVRGRYVGYALMCAPLGTIVGVPLATVLAETVGLWLAFVVVALLVAVLIGVSARSLPPAAVPPPDVGAEASAPAPAWYAPLRQGGVRAAVLVAFLWGLLSFGLYNFLAIWLQQDFSLLTAEIGLIFAGLGGASVLGNFLVASFSDRLGKRRAALIGLVLASIGALLVSRAPSLALALPLLVGFSVANDFGFGALLALMTELLPTRRGAMMSLYMIALGLSAISAPLVAGLVWDRGGFSLLVLVLSGLGGVALLLGLWSLPDAGQGSRRRRGVPRASTE